MIMQFKKLHTFYKLEKAPYSLFRGRLIFVSGKWRGMHFLEVGTFSRWEFSHKHCNNFDKVGFKQCLLERQQQKLLLDEIVFSENI